MTVSLDKDTKTYRFHFRYLGRRYVKRGFQTRTAAANAETDRRREVAAGLVTSYATFSDLEQAFLLESTRTKSAPWCKQLVWKLDKWCHDWRNVPPERIRPVQIASLLQRIADTPTVNGPRSARSVNEMRRVLHSVFEFAVRLETLPRNPVKAVARMPEPEVMLPPIPTTDLRKLVMSAPPALSRQIIVQALSGARWVEIARLVRADVYLEARPPYCVLRSRKKRGGSERLRKQYLPGPAVEALRQQLAEIETERVFPGPRGMQQHDAASKRLRRACVRAGIPPYGYHAIRRWAGTVAMESGQPNRHVGAFLGHTTTAVTDRYTWIANPVNIAIGEHLAIELLK